MKILVGSGQSSARFCSRCTIRPFSICAALDSAEADRLAQIGDHVDVASGETLFAQDDAITSFYTLHQGVMRLYKLLPDGRRQIVGFALPGDFLGMAAGDRHGFSADAIGRAVICRFSRRSFAQFIETRPSLLGRINEFAACELGRARDQMVLLGRRSAEEKVATFLVDWRDRLARLDGATTTLTLPMSRQDLADFLGLTIETVSRTLTRLARDGVIEIAAHSVRLLDTARVEALAAA